MDSSAPTRSQSDDCVPLEPETELTIEHLVALLQIADGCAPHLPTERLAAQAIDHLVVQSPSVRPLLVRLTRLARDAACGQDRAGLLDGYATHCDVEALLATEDWENPADILDPDGEIGLDLDSLIAACRARLARNEGDQGAVRRALAKVERSPA